MIIYQITRTLARGEVEVEAALLPLQRLLEELLEAGGQAAQVQLLAPAHQLQHLIPQLLVGALPLSNHVVQVLVPQLLPGPALPSALPAPLQLDPHVALPAAPLASSSPAPPPARLGLGGVLGVGQLLPQLPHHHLVAGPVLTTHCTLTLLQLELTV